MLGNISLDSIPDAFDDGSSKPLVETLTDFSIEALENARDVIKSYIAGMKESERGKYEKIQEQIDDYIEQLKKSKKSGLMGVIFKVLGALAVAFAFICAVVAPSPLSIAILVVAIAMFMEPLVADAAGYDSLIQQGMGEMMDVLSGAFGKIGAMVIATILMLVLVVGCTALLSAGFSAMSTGTSTMLQNVRQFATSMVEMLSKMVGGGANISREAFGRFLEYIQATLMMAQGGVGIDFNVLKLESAKLMKEIGVDQVVIDAWTEIINLLSDERHTWQEVLNRLEDLIPELFGPTANS